MIVKNKADIRKYIKHIFTNNRYSIFLIDLIIIMSLINSHIFTLAVVKGNSMYPTMSDRDIIFVNRTNQMPKRGDIVLIRTTLDELEEYIIKRIIAIEGETVVIDYCSNKIYVNGKEISEPYIRAYLKT